MTQLSTLIRPMDESDFRWAASLGTTKEFPLCERGFHFIFRGPSAGRVHGLISALRIGDPIGFVLFGRATASVLLFKVVVDPHYRRLGIGSSLVRYVLAGMNQTRSIVRSWVDEQNLEAQLFFRSLGFRAILPACVKNDTVCYLMEKRLDKFELHNRISRWLNHKV